MKTIAVIGPDEAEAKKVAEQLTGVRAVPGAGPGKDIDGVVAVAGEPTVEAVEIVQAVARNIGVVAVLSDHRWPSIPGVHVRGSQDVAGLQRLIDRLYVDTKQWEMAARRADQQRLEQVRVAVRLICSTRARAATGSRNSSRYFMPSPPPVPVPPRESRGP